MYIRDLIPRNFAELAEAVPIDLDLFQVCKYSHASKIHYVMTTTKPNKEYHLALICHITAIIANTIKNIIPCIICIINLTCQ